MEDQGDMVTSIEFNIESTSVQVTEGTEQLRQAKTFKVNFALKESWQAARAQFTKHGIHFFFAHPCTKQMHASSLNKTNFRTA